MSLNDNKPQLVNNGGAGAGGIDLCADEIFSLLKL